MHAPRLVFLTIIMMLASCATPATRDDAFVLTVVGINDIHGQLAANQRGGGLVGISAYVNSLRAAREADGGAVLVVDAGDMWQGTLESNLLEGASVVEAYNALGVDAAAIGNHEFDFGPAGTRAIPRTAEDDPRGALRQRAREAQFPLLAANLIDVTTGQAVRWDNVQPSTLIEAGGITVGIVGVMTRRALQTTIAANTVGLRVAPLAETVTREARALRRAGATVVIVVAHAGGKCADLSNPLDISSCDLESEVIRLARDLDSDDVDHIFGGHVDHEIAHVFDGISVTTNRSRARSFGRVDFHLDPERREIRKREVYPPQRNELQFPAAYEGIPPSPVPGVVHAAATAAGLAAEFKQQRLGVVLEDAFPLERDLESALFNLVTEAMLDSFDVDIVIHNVVGGLRNGLPAGELTYGAVYEMFPFDNFVTINEISGRELRRIIAAQSIGTRRAGFAGMRVFIECRDGFLDVRMRRADGSLIRDEDRITLLANDYLALGGDGILEPAIPDGGFEPRFDMPRTRDTLIEWFRQHGGTLRLADWRSHDAPKWNLGGVIADHCTL